MPMNFQTRKKTTAGGNQSSSAAAKTQSMDGKCDWLSYLAIKLLFRNRICPAVFVIANKSMNRSKNDQEAGMWLWPTCLNWKSKAIRLASHVARHVHRIGYTRQWWGD